MERSKLLGSAFLAACGFAAYIGASFGGGESRATQDRTVELLERLDVQSRATAAGLEELRRGLDRGPTGQPELPDVSNVPARRIEVPGNPVAAGDGDGVEVTLGELAAQLARIEAALDARAQAVVRPGEQHPRNTAALERIPSDEGLEVLVSEMFGWPPADVYRRYGLPDSVNAGPAQVIWEYRFPERIIEIGFSAGGLEYLRSISTQ